MKKTFLTMAIAILAAGISFAQQPIDEELNRLIANISLLRTGDQAAWEQAKGNFATDDEWTMMDEIKSDPNEYRMIGGNYFKLNNILTTCSGYDKSMTTGDFLNGNDPNFKYSLIERGIKKGCTVKYEMKCRKGKQTFVVMPYDAQKADQVELEAFVNGKSVGKGQAKDGNIIVDINRNIDEADTIRLEIANKSDVNMPMVIINHNTRTN